MIAIQSKNHLSKQKHFLFMKLTLMLGLGSILVLGAAITSFTIKAKDQVRHVVVFKYKPSATAAQIEEVTKAFRGLKEKIPGIMSFEHGDNNSPEKKDQGFNHVYLLTFESAAARDAYLPHPDHKKFGDLLGKLQVLEDVFVVDYKVTE
jgi:Stress responsive A/B Barrel Domain